MFAFSAWDGETKSLYLARDRLGEKPLFYGRLGETLIFGSELKAFRLYPSWRGKIDRSALTEFLRHGYVPGPLSIFENTKKLAPGHYIQIFDPTLPDHQSTRYWSPPPRTPQLQKIDSTEARAEATRLLRDSVSIRMQADVPLGAFLSGGYDSSLIVAMMQAGSSSRTKTFTIGFGEHGHDEAPNARAVAEHLQTDHTELYVEADVALRVISELPEIWDEPFADSSQIPTLILSRLARESVTVALSGDGGDELFGGYERYSLALRLWEKLILIPEAMRPAIADALGISLVKQIARAYEMAGRPLSVAHMAQAIKRLSDLVRPTDAMAFYKSLVSMWTHPEQVVVDGHRSITNFDLGVIATQSDTLLTRMAVVDAYSYLPDDILTKVDRASMACGLEARAPMLDHRLVEFAFSLPDTMKIRKGRGKWLLKEIAHGFVEPELLNRPKQGFAAPVAGWLRGPLKPWASELLDSRQVSADGYFDAAEVDKCWRDHLSGLYDNQYKLWPILMFQSWLNVNRAFIDP